MRRVELVTTGDGTKRLLVGSGIVCCCYSWKLTGRGNCCDWSGTCDVGILG